MCGEEGKELVEWVCGDIVRRCRSRDGRSRMVGVECEVLVLMGGELVLGRSVFALIWKIK